MLGDTSFGKEDFRPRLSKIRRLSADFAVIAEKAFLVEE
jgi:hypothetical protein